MDSIGEMIVAGLTNQEIAAQLGVTTRIAKDRRRNWVNRQILDSVVKPQPKMPKTDPTDRTWWVEHITEQTGTKTVMHICDVHFPFTDKAALALVLQIFADLKPDYAVVGSDSLDLLGMSRFISNPHLLSLVDDEVETAGLFWRWYIATLQKLSPGTIFVYLDGNHEQRLMRYLYENAARVQITVQKAWVNMLRLDGAVKYLGQIPEIRFNGLSIIHGQRTNIHASQSTLKDDFAGQRCVGFGHVHRFTEAVIEGPSHNVWATSSGCLMLQPPYYAPHKREQQGTNIYWTDMDSSHPSARYAQLVFSKRDNGALWTVANGRIYEAHASDKIGYPMETFPDLTRLYTMDYEEAEIEA